MSSQSYNVDAVLELRAEFEKQREDAIGQLLQEIRERAAKLVRLGYKDVANAVKALGNGSVGNGMRAMGNGSVGVGNGGGTTSASTTAPPSKAARSKRAGVSGKVCPICDEKGHDGRKHRWEEFRAAKAAAPAKTPARAKKPTAKAGMSVGNPKATTKKNAGRRKKRGR